MRALTLTQPWASLVAVGAKRVETRSWGTRYRGPLAIHAAKSLTPAGGKEHVAALVTEEPFRSALEPIREYHDRAMPFAEADGAELRLGEWREQNRQDGKPPWSHVSLPLGAIIAVCELTEVRHRNVPGLNAFLARYGGPHEREFGDYDGAGRSFWALTEVRALPAPVPCRGYQGLWTVPPELAVRLAR